MFGINKLLKNDRRSLIDSHSLVDTKQVCIYVVLKIKLIYSHPPFYCCRWRVLNRQVEDNLIQSNANMRFGTNHINQDEGW